MLLRCWLETLATDLEPLISNIGVDPAINSTVGISQVGKGGLPPRSSGLSMGRRQNRASGGKPPFPTCECLSLERFPDQLVFRSLSQKVFKLDPTAHKRSRGCSREMRGDVYPVALGGQGC
jgi:hypothetical protein